LTKQRSTLVKRRTAVYSRLDALIELLGPAWYDVLGTDYSKSGLAFLARYADPQAVLRLGEACRGSCRPDRVASTDPHPRRR
jgi:hypothetical protein